MHRWNPGLKIFFPPSGYQCTRPCWVAGKYCGSLQCLSFYSSYRNGGIQISLVRKLQYWWRPFCGAGFINFFSNHLVNSNYRNYSSYWLGKIRCGESRLDIHVCRVDVVLKNVYTFYVIIPYRFQIRKHFNKCSLEQNEKSKLVQSCASCLQLCWSRSGSSPCIAWWPSIYCSRSGVNS